MKPDRSCILLIAAALLATVSPPGSTAHGQTADPATDMATDPAASQDLRALVAPVAFYPDDLLALILPASTFPAEIVQAARLLDERQSDPTLEPEPSWDPSVIALLNYPDVVTQMNDQADGVPGGRYDYVINGNMIAGFGLLAVPARYGETGVTTFMVSHHGTVWEKDLGPETALLAAAIQEVRLDESWGAVEE